MADLEPITRKEMIISGEDLEPITREEWFLKQYGGGGGSASEQIMFVTGTKSTSQGLTHATLSKSFSEMYNYVKDGGKTIIITVDDLIGSGKCYLMLDSIISSGTKKMRFSPISSLLIERNGGIGENGNATIRKPYLQILETADNVADLYLETVYRDISQVLTAGMTYMTITDDSIRDNSTVDIYTSIWGAEPTSVIVYIGGINLTFEEQSENMTVKVRIS